MLLFLQELSIHAKINRQTTPILHVLNTRQLFAECMNTNFIKHLMLSVYHCLIFLFVLLVGVLAIANLCGLYNLKVCHKIYRWKLQCAVVYFSNWKLATVVTWPHNPAQLDSTFFSIPDFDPIRKFSGLSQRYYEPILIFRHFSIALAHIFRELHLLHMYTKMWLHKIVANRKNTLIIICLASQ